MALQAKTAEQRQHINTLLDKMQIAYSDAKEDGVLIDDFIKYDDMAEIVDFLRMDVPRKELFETCWKAYRRKGLKKKAMEYWKKLTDVEKENVLPHIKAYVATRDLQFQKDFERYLRDKVFMTIVYQGNSVVYDPTKLENGDNANEVYTPQTSFVLSYNESSKCYIYIGFWDGHIPDGYTDGNRPDGATVVLNNARGTVRWNKGTRTWDKV